MPIVYDELMALKNLDQKYAYTDRDVMLYAYGIGMGADPMDEKELAFVNEGVLTPRPLKVVPTIAAPPDNLERFGYNAANQSAPEGAFR